MKRIMTNFLALVAAVSLMITPVIPAAWAESSSKDDTSSHGDLQDHPSVTVQPFIGPGIEKYFNYIITSEKSGYQKPERGIFDYALQVTNATKDECLFVGDDVYADMLGAQNAGWDHVFYNPDKRNHLQKFTFEIHSLSALKKLL